LKRKAKVELKFGVSGRWLRLSSTWQGPVTVFVWTRRWRWGISQLCG